MTVRVWKNVLRSKMRATAAAHVGITGAALRAVLITMIVTELNYIVGGHTPPEDLELKNGGPRLADSSALRVTRQHEVARNLSAAFGVHLADGTAWNNFVKTHIQLKFGLDNSALTKEEMRTGFDLAIHLLKVPLLVDLCTVLGIQLRPESVARFQSNPSLFSGPLPIMVRHGPDTVLYLLVLID
jgi:hypothetical protein